MKEKDVFAKEVHVTDAHQSSFAKGAYEALLRAVDSFAYCTMFRFGTARGGGLVS